MKHILNLSLIILFFLTIACDSKVGESASSEHSEEVDALKIDSIAQVEHQVLETIEEDVKAVILEEELIEYDTADTEAFEGEDRGLEVVEVTAGDEKLMLKKQEEFTDSTVSSADTTCTKEHVNDESETFYSNMLVQCPPKMKEGSEYGIIACLYRDSLDNEIMQTIASSKNIPVQEVENSSKIKKIILTRKYEIAIIFDKADFELLSETATIKGIIRKGPQWYEWTIKPLKPGKNKKITIRVENLDEDGNKYRSLPDKEISIDVIVNNRGLVTNMWMFVRDNPEWTLTSLIIPVFVYFFRQYKRRKKRKYAEKNEAVD